MTREEKLLKTIDKIEELKSNLLELTPKLRKEYKENLEVKKMQSWSDWKDE